MKVRSQAQSDCECVNDQTWVEVNKGSGQLSYY